VNSVIRVLLVDDHAVVREGYRRLLERDHTIEVVGEAGNGIKARALAASAESDVVIMDIALPGSSGLDVMRQMLADRPELRVLIFSMHGEAIFVSRAIRHGARGYITKSSAPEVLVDAVHAVAQGATYYSADVMAEASSSSQVSAPGVQSLTSREFEVLQRLVTGESVKDIGDKLGLSEKTVANHQSIIREKLGVKNGVQLARLAAELGLMPKA